MNHKHELIKGGMYLTFGSVITFILTYFFRILVSRNFSVEQYGLFFSILNFLNFFIFFIYLGLDKAAIYYIIKYHLAEEYNHIKTILFTSILLQLLAILILILFIFIFGNYLEINYFKYPGSGNMLKIFSLFLLFNIFGMINYMTIYGFNRINIFSFYDLTFNLLSLIILILFLKSNLKLYSPIMAYVLSSFLVILIFLPFSMKIFPFFKYKIEKIKSTAIELMRYGLPALLISIGLRTLMQTDTLLLTKFSSLHEVGLYQAAQPLANLFVFLSVGVTTLLFPFLAHLYNTNEFEKMSLYLSHIFKYLILLLLFAVTFFIIFSEEILGFIFGASYVPAKGIFIILLISVIFNVLCSINLQVIYSFNKQKQILKLILVVAAINIVFNLFLIPQFGGIGAAVSSTLSYLLLLFFSWRLVIKNVPISLEIKKYLLLLLVCVLFLIPLLGFNFSQMWLKLGCFSLFAVIYIFLLFLLKLFSKEELSGLVKAV